MSSEEGGLVVPKPARGRRGTMAVKIPTRREALEKAVEHLLAEVEKSHCSVEMAPQYEEDLGRVRDYLGVEKVGGKRLREVEGVSDARERLKIGGDARPAGGELMLVPIKEEKTARPEVEEGNEEDEEKERGGLKRKSEDVVGPLTKVSLRVNRGKMSAQSEEDRASDQERRGFERGWTTRREWICPSQLTRLTEEDYAELGVYARTLGIYDDVRLSWEHQLRGVQRYLYNVAGELLSEEKIKVSKKKEYPPSVPFAPGERVEFMLAENVWVEGVLTARFTKTHVMVALDDELLRRAWCCIRRVRSKDGRDVAPDVMRENAAGGAAHRHEHPRAVARPIARPREVTRLVARLKARLIARLETRLDARLQPVARPVKATRVCPRRVIRIFPRAWMKVAMWLVVGARWTMRMRVRVARADARQASQLTVKEATAARVKPMSLRRLAAGER